MALWKSTRRNWKEEGLDQTFVSLLYSFPGPSSLLPPNFKRLLVLDPLVWNYRHVQPLYSGLFSSYPPKSGPPRLLSRESKLVRAKTASESPCFKIRNGCGRNFSFSLSLSCWFCFSSSPPPSPRDFLYLVIKTSSCRAGAAALLIKERTHPGCSTPHNLVHF